MKLSAKQYASYLSEALESVSASQQNLVLANFVKLLAGNHQLSLWQKIINDFKNLYDKKNNVLAAQVKTPRPLAKEQKDELTKRLGRIFDKTVTLNETIDESLIGGPIILGNDFIIDASLKVRLNQLGRKISLENN
ncbi:MAG TPA: ATP synthase F1 subunit delta [Patescibacteria group bacterium]|nr:ATP synthase F1 subunit delta [Patescibacteria group bacterium]